MLNFSGSINVDIVTAIAVNPHMFMKTNSPIPAPICMTDTIIDKTIAGINTTLLMDTADSIWEYDTGIFIIAFPSFNKRANTQARHMDSSHVVIKILA